MSLLEPASSSSRHEPVPLQSLQPSPTEEDLGGASVWRDGDGEEDDGDDGDEGMELERRIHGNGSVSASAKGKERQRVQEISLDEEESEGAVTPTLEGGYPPLKEDEEESRKVEENLRRWELAERQRRKASRESGAFSVPNSTGTNTSTTTTIGRGASLWSKRTSGVHTVHTQLGQSSEDALPLNDLHSVGVGSGDGGSNSLLSPAVSKPPSPTSPTENPFEPPDSATPLSGLGFGDGDGGGDAVMRASSPPPPTPPEGARSPFGDEAAAEARPTLQATSSFSQPLHPLSGAPPPMPLDLPPPKTPPPRMRTPGGVVANVSSQPGRVPALSSSQRATTRRMEQEQEQGGPEREQEQEHRWWTEWLCGCREEKDRDNAGRTNPFE